MYKKYFKKKKKKKKKRGGGGGGGGRGSFLIKNVQTYGPLISKHLKSLIKNDFKQCVLGRDTPSMNFLIEYNIILKI